MRREAKKRGRGPSHVLMTPDHAGNVVGVDPHKRTLTATVADARGGILSSAHFRVSGDGHRELEAWARQFGQIARWGIEGSASWGRHTAVFLLGRGHDVRDVCANRTPRSDRARQRGKSDTLDSERIAREVLAHPLLAKAFKRAGQDHGPDEQHQLLALWHNRRRSIVTGRQHLVGEAESLLCELPLELREQLPDTKAVKPRLAALAQRNRRRRYDAPTQLRLQLLDGYRTQIKALDLEEKQVLEHLDALVDRSGSTLGELSGLSTRSVAELLVEVGDARRFTEGGFARFNGSAPLPASTAEGPGEPVRHRYNPGGNRRINAILHRMAVTQLRFEPRAQAIYANARAHGHTKKEARRILKRHLSDVIYRRMIRDLAAADRAPLSAQPLLAA
jgi:transposase